MVDKPNDKRSPAAETITPIPYRPADRNRRILPGISLKWLIGTSLVMVLFGLVAIAAVVFTARQVMIQIEPPPVDISIRGGLFTARYGDHYLMRPGKYTIQATKPCYTPLEAQLVVGSEKRQHFRMTLQQLPGKISVRVHPQGAPDEEIRTARVYLEGEEVGYSPLIDLAASAGVRQIDVQSERYQDYHGTVTVEGCGQHQELNLALTPGWSDVAISSVPTGAIVMVDGAQVGETPVTLELPAGTHEVHLIAERHKTWQTRLVTEAGVPMELSGIRLAPADGKLMLKSSPAGARVMIGKRYFGQTPLEVTLTPAIPQVVHLSKAGYKDATRTVQIETDAEQTMEIRLEAVKGLVHFSIQPAGAELLINGRSMGKVPQQLRLLSTVQTIEIRKKGYQPYRTRITPQPGFPQDIKAVLKALTPSATSLQEIVKARNGYALKLVRPGPFVMGSSRRQQGRRANETLRKIKLERPFYMGITEVTNREFKEFLADHDSGVIKSINLNTDDLPAVQISWEQAALFCNWLSARESLPAAYVLKNGKLVAAEPMTTGYRLPSEAEWEYCARYTPSGVKLKYPWGAKFPPKPMSGNFADVSAQSLLANTIDGYDDGYPAAAPPGKFPANALGFRDMGGNVSEWCNDYYDIYSYNADKVVTDPTGPKDGSLRVVRGSSWRHASISSLRLTYRDYSNTKRPDLGFRICRYAK